MARVTTAFVLLLVSACGQSEAAKACRDARASAAGYLDLAGHRLAGKTDVPASVQPFAPMPPAADAAVARWEAAIEDLDRIEIALNDSMIATATAREALREPARQALATAAATLLDDEADAAATARAALPYLAQLDALDVAAANQAAVLLGKAKALRDRLASGSDGALVDRMRLMRSSVDTEITLLEFRSRPEDPFALEKLGLTEVIARCRR